MQEEGGQEPDQEMANEKYGRSVPLNTGTAAKKETLLRVA